MQIAKHSRLKNIIISCSIFTNPLCLSSLRGSDIHGESEDCKCKICICRSFRYLGSLRPLRFSVWSNTSLDHMKGSLTVYLVKGVRWRRTVSSLPATRPGHGGKQVAPNGSLGLSVFSSPCISMEFSNIHKRTCSHFVQMSGISCLLLDFLFPKEGLAIVKLDCSQHCKILF